MILVKIYCYYILQDCKGSRNTDHNQLKFHNHTTAVVKKANRILAVIHKIFQYFDHNTFINLYKSYIRPCSVRVWQHHLGTTVHPRPRTNRESTEKNYQVDE